MFLAAVKRTEKAMRNKLSVQQGEEGDEEDDEMDASAKDKQWGKSKRGYYGADTEDYEVPFISRQQNAALDQPLWQAWMCLRVKWQVNSKGVWNTALLLI